MATFYGSQPATKMLYCLHAYETLPICVPLPARNPPPLRTGDWSSGEGVVYVVDLDPLFVLLHLAAPVIMLLLAL